jgi:hypothetical protein
MYIKVFVAQQLTIKRKWSYYKVDLCSLLLAVFVNKETLVPTILHLIKVEFHPKLINYMLTKLRIFE